MWNAVHQISVHFTIFYFITSSKILSFSLKSQKHLHPTIHMVGFFDVAAEKAPRPFALLDVVESNLSLSLHKA